MIDQLAGKRILITGGTGFVGCALLGRLRGSGAKVSITTRDLASFKKAASEFVNLPIIYYDGMTAIDIHPNTEFDYIIHLEDSGTDALNHILQLAGNCGARMLFASSGAVYGRNAAIWASELELTHADTAYATRKAVQEAEGHLALLDGYVSSFVVARLFAFVGPYLPLDGQYAIGNFIGNGLRGEPILVNGTGEAIRSYLYTTDMADWLLGLLLNGKSGEAYNVGSEYPVTIADLAAVVSQHFAHRPEVIIKGDKGQASNVYIPSTNKARTLGLRQTVMLDDAIEKTIEFWRERGK